MKYIIIGLGNYGSCLSEELTSLGHEVIGVDLNEEKVDNIKDKIATAFALDASDEHSLSVLPLKEVDVVIVAVGENFGASVRIVALLKQHKVKHIYARAIDYIHKSILDAFDLEKVLIPEEDGARNLVELLEFGYKMDTFKLSDDLYIAKFTVPERFVGRTLAEISLQEEFHIKLIGVMEEKEVLNLVGISSKEHFLLDTFSKNREMEKGDIIVCCGKYSALQKLWKLL